MSPKLKCFDIAPVRDNLTVGLSRTGKIRSTLIDELTAY